MTLRDASAGGFDPLVRGLTPREHGVLELVRLGKSNKEIAQQLGRSAKTVQFHVSNILQKTGVKSRLMLIVSLGRD